MNDERASNLIWKYREEEKVCFDNHLGLFLLHIYFGMLFKLQAWDTSQVMMYCTYGILVYVRENWYVVCNYNPSLVRNVGHDCFGDKEWLYLHDGIHASLSNYHSVVWDMRICLVATMGSLWKVHCGKKWLVCFANPLLIFLPYVFPDLISYPIYGS